MANDQLEQYAACAKRHGQATQDGDSRSANAAHDKLYEVFKELKGAGELTCLEPLLQDPDAHVRCWAATHFLLVDKGKATKVLKALSKGRGIVAFNAETVLTEWRAGRLKSPE